MDKPKIENPEQGLPKKPVYETPEQGKKNTSKN